MSITSFNSWNKDKKGDGASASSSAQTNSGNVSSFRDWNNGTNTGNTNSNSYSRNRTLGSANRYNNILTNRSVNNTGDSFSNLVNQYVSGANTAYKNGEFSQNRNDWNNQYKSLMGFLDDYGSNYDKSWVDNVKNLLNTTYNNTNPIQKPLDTDTKTTAPRKFYQTSDMLKNLLSTTDIKTKNDLDAYYASIGDRSVTDNMNNQQLSDAINYYKNNSASRKETVSNYLTNQADKTVEDVENEKQTYYWNRYGELSKQGYSESDIESIVNKEIADGYYNKQSRSPLMNINMYDNAADNMQKELDYRKRMQPYSSLYNNEDYEDNSAYDNASYGYKGYHTATDGRTGTTLSRNELTEPMKTQLFYDAVNGNKQAIEMLSYAKDMEGNMVEADPSVERYMTKDEVSNFNYLYKTKGADAAMEYYNLILDDLNYRYKEDYNAQIAEEAKDPVNAAAMSLWSVVSAPLNAVTNLASMGYDLATKGTVNTNDPRYTYANEANTMRSSVGSAIREAAGGEDSFWGQAAGIGYDTTMSILDNLYGMGTGSVISKALGLTGTIANKATEAVTLAIMGTNSAANSMYANLEAGMDTTSAIILGFGSGAIEVITEKIGLDNLFESAWRGKSAWTSWAKQVLSEGSEEVLGSGMEDALGLIYDTISGTSSSDFSREVNSYILEHGLAPNQRSEAEAAVLNQHLLQYGIAGLEGGLSGGMMGAGAMGLNSFTASRAMNSYVNEMSKTQFGDANEAADIDVLRSLIEEGYNTDRDSKYGSRAYDLARTAALEAKTGNPTNKVSADLYDALIKSDFESQNNAEEEASELEQKAVSEANYNGASKALINKITEAISNGTKLPAKASAYLSENTINEIRTAMGEVFDTADEYAAESNAQEETKTAEHRENVKPASELTDSGIREDAQTQKQAEYDEAKALADNEKARVKMIGETFVGRTSELFDNIIDSAVKTGRNIADTAMAFNEVYRAQLKGQKAKADTDLIPDSIQQVIRNQADMDNISDKAKAKLQVEDEIKAENHAFIRDMADQYTDSIKQQIVLGYREGTDVEAYGDAVNSIVESAQVNAEMPVIPDEVIPESTQNNIYNAVKKELGNGREILVPEISGRDAVQNTGIESASMVSKTGAAQKTGRIQRIIDTQNRINELKVTGDKVAGNQLTPNGVTGTKYSLIDWQSNDDTREAKKIADEKGLELVLVAGNSIRTYDQNRNIINSRGLVDGNKVIVRADDTDYTATQILKHEATHPEFRTADREAKINAIVESIKSEIGEEAYNVIESVYMEAYADAEMAFADVYEEMICDIKAGMNVFGEIFKNRIMAVDWYENVLSNIKAVTDKTMGEWKTGKTSAANETTNEVKHSMELDSDGNKLTEAQQKFFDNSKLRDNNGNLQVFYHGTIRYDEITKFKRGKNGYLGAGIYITNDQSVANRYSEGYGTIYKLYANVTNPLTVTSISPAKEILNLLYGSDKMYEKRTAKYDGNSDVYIISNADINKLKNKGYDGIVWDYAGSREVNVFDTSQIKRVDNENPTSNADIRYSRTLEGANRADTNVLEEKVINHESLSSYDELQYSRELKDEIYNKAKEYNAEHGNVIRSDVLKEAKKALDETAKLLSQPRVLKLLPDESNVLSGTKDENGVKRTTLFGNASYGWSAENTTVCIRSLAMEDLLDRVAQRLGHSLTVGEAVAVSQMAWAYTDEPTCQYCYVWADRAAERAARGIYIETRDAALKAIGEIGPNDPILTADDLITLTVKKDKSISDRKFLITKAEAAHPELKNQLRAYKEYLGKRDNTINQRERFVRFLENAKYGKRMVSAADVATESDMAKAIEDYPELRAEMEDIQRYASNASHAKKKVSYTAYNNDILDISDATVKMMNQNYGIRFYSYSDFHPAFILENMQMYTDAAVRQLKGLAYTKDLDYVRIFAKTGANINISIKAIDNTTEMDGMQGADWEQAKDLRSKHKNVGIIIVATSDAQVKWAMEQDWIDVIIPYHVCFSDEVGKIFGWKNYKAVQDDKKLRGIWKEGNLKHITPPMHQNDFSKYIQLCEDNGLRPRFDKWLVADDGTKGYKRGKTYSAENNPNYMKLVNETRQSESETGLLQPVFETSYVEKCINDMVKKGGYNNPFGGSIETLEDLADEFAERVKEGDNGLKFSRELDKAKAKESNDYEAAIQELKNKVITLEIDKRNLEFLKKHYQGELELSAHTKGSAAYNAQKPLISEAKSINIARGLIKSYGSTISYKDIAPDIQKYVTYLASHKDNNTFDTVHEGCIDIARKLVESAQEIVDDYGKDVQKFIRNTTIKISPSTRTDIQDYNEWRKSMFGKMRISLNKGETVDEVCNMLGEKFGANFDFRNENGTETDQLLAIADFVSNYTPATQNPYSYDMASAIEGVALEVYNELLNSPVFKPTFADKSAAKIAQIEEYNRQKIDSIKRSMREETRRRVDEAKKAAQEKANKARTKRQDADLKIQLLKLANRADKLKTNNANKAAIQSLIKDIDLTAVNMSLGKAKDLQAFVAWSDQMAAENPDFFINQKEYNEAIKRLNTKKIGDMNIDDVRDLIKSLRVLMNDIYWQNRLVGDESRREVTDMAAEISRDIENSRGMNGGIHGKFDEIFIKGTLSPVRFAHRLTGYAENDPLYRAVASDDGLAGGQRKMLSYQQEATDLFTKWTDDRKFTKDITGTKADVLSFDVTTVDGKQKTINMTKAMRMSLYLHSQNADSMRHMCGYWEGPSEQFPNGRYIPGGGFVLPNMQTYKKGRVAEAYGQGKQLVKIKQSELRKLFQGMSKQELEFAAKMKEYFNGMSQHAINDISEKLVGISLAEVKNYFPIVVSKEFLGADYGNIKMDGTIEGMGMLKERIQSGKPIDILDATTVLTRSIESTARYVGLAIPVRNINKLLGVNFAATTADGTIVPYDDSILNEISYKWGSSAKKYIEKMISDMQSPGREVEPLEKAIAKLRSGYAGAVLTWNLSVAMKQAASYPTAAGILGWSPLVKAMGEFGKVDLDLIKKYTPLQAYRTKGFSTTELGDIQSQNRFFSNLPKGLNWIQGMDLITTRKLWKASEIYVQDNNKNLEVGTEEYYKEVAKIYNQVIEETQPNYTALQRPEYLRSHSGIVQTLMMFKTQPFQNFNVLYDAVFNYKAKKAQYVNGIITKEDLNTAKTKLSRAITSQVGQLITFAAMTMLWNIFRRREQKYKDEDGNWSLAVMSETLGKDVASGVAGMIPFGADVYELFSSVVFGDKYYGFESVTDSAISDVLGAVKDTADLIGDVVNDIKTDGFDFDKYKKNMKSIASGLSKMGGIPYDNVANLFDALFEQTLEGVADITGIEGYTDYILNRYKLNPGDSSNKKTFSSDLYTMYKEGDSHYEEAYNFLSDKIDNIDNALKDRYLEDITGGTKASELYDDLYTKYGTEEYEAAVNEAYLFGFTEDAVKQGIKAAYARSVSDNSEATLDDAYANLLDLYRNNSADYKNEYDRMISRGFTDDQIQTGIEKILKSEQNVSKVNDLDERYYTPAQIAENEKKAAEKAAEEAKKEADKKAEEARKQAEKEAEEKKDKTADVGGYSGWIQTVKYNKSTKTLTVTTKAGKTYVHENVDESVYNNMVNGDPGRVYNDTFK